MLPAAAAGSAPALSALTSLRFVAAFAVLLLHYRELLGPLPPWLLRGVIGGQYGVTFFFVLSGFILTWRYHDWFARGVDEPHYLWFQRFRLARLYPVYLLGLLLDTPAHLVERAQDGALASHGALYWASWLINLLGLQAWVPGVPYAMFWNTPAWSVSAELFFYAIFPFVTLALARHVRSGAGLAAAFVAAVLGGIALYAGVIYWVTWVRPLTGEPLYILLVYTPLLRCAEFLAGCVLGQHFLRTQRAGGGGWLAHSAARRNVLLLACLAVIALRVWSPDYTGPSRWWWLLDVAAKYGVFIAPFALVILVVASGRTFLHGWLERPWMVLLGEASYALYIIHWSVVTVINQKWLGAWSTPAVHASLLLATVAASVLVYRFFELPWRVRLRGRPPEGLSP
jgi:peptidoglycan/LPS O-acetylase OafA/YrhL